MSHSHAYHRLLHRWILFLVVLIQLVQPVSAGAMSWFLEPTQAPSADWAALPRNSSLYRAPGETREAFFMRVGQTDPQRLQLAALRALEYYLNHPAPAGAPDDAFERLVERYLALPVAMLRSAEAQVQVAGPPSPPPAPVIRAAAPASAPAQAATSPPTAPVAPEPVETRDVADEIATAPDPATVIPSAEDAPTAAPPSAATPTPMPTPLVDVAPTHTSTATSVATVAPAATRLPTRVASPAPTRQPVAIAAVEPASAPSRETRTVGVIKITADTFTDLGGGKTQAAGNVVIGNYLPLLGANDVVTYDASTLTPRSRWRLRWAATRSICSRVPFQRPWVQAWLPWAAT
jgi:hypothetical protein